MKRLTIALVFLLGCVFSNSLANEVTSSEARAYQYFLLGTILEAEGDLDNALKLYKQVLNLDENASAEVYYRIATVYVLKNDLESAGQVLKQLIDRYPDEIGAYLWLLRILLKEGKTQEVDQYYEALLKKAIELSPDNVVLYRSLGEYYMKQGKFDKAIFYLKEAVKRGTVDPDPYFFLGALYDQQGDVDAAITYLKKALNKDPDYDLALNYLGYLYAQLGKNLDEAERLLKRALELKPNEPAYMDSLGWVYVKKGQLDLAEEYIKKATMREDPEIYYHMGYVYFLKKDYEQAKSYLGLALAWVEEDSPLKKKILDLLKKVEAKLEESGSESQPQARSVEEKELVSAGSNQ